MRIRHAAALAALTGAALAVTAALPASAATTESTVVPVEVTDVTLEMWSEDGPFVPLVEAGEVEFPLSFTNTSPDFAASAFLVPAGPEGCTRAVSEVAIALEISPSLESRELQMVITTPPGIYNPGATAVYEGPGEFIVEDMGFGALRLLDPLEEAASATIRYTLAEPLDASEAYLLFGMITVDDPDTMASITAIEFAVIDTCPEPAQLAATGSTVASFAFAAGAGILALGAALLIARRRLA